MASFSGSGFMSEEKQWVLVDSKKRLAFAVASENIQVNTSRWFYE